MSNKVESPLGRPGDIYNWPMLKCHYRTDAKCIAALLPPGISVGADPVVNLTFYNYPVPDVPEYGIVITVNADYNGTLGEFTIAYGIDQESAIFISQERNGQPKVPCQTDYYLAGDQVRARSTHQGYTFVEFIGKSTGKVEGGGEFVQNEWWLKYSRAVCTWNEVEDFDLPPTVVHVKATWDTEWKERVEGRIILRDSPWDPLSQLLPMREQLECYLWWPKFVDRSVTVGGKLDPKAFYPYADTISNSRWPGLNGAPKPEYY